LVWGGLSGQTFTSGGGERGREECRKQLRRRKERILRSERGTGELKGDHKLNFVQKNQEKKRVISSKRNMILYILN